MQLRQQESRKRFRLWWSLATVALFASLIVGGTLWARSVERNARQKQSVELKASAENELASGNFADAEQQLSLAIESSPSESDELNQLSEDIALCQNLDEVFQQQASSHAIRHMGIVVSTREQDAARRQALEQYDNLLNDPDSLVRRFENSSGKTWLAAAFGSRAWLMNQFRPEDEEEIESCLESAKKLDTKNEFNAYLYDSENWDESEAVAEKLKTDSARELSQGALNLATEILIRGNADPEVIKDVVAQRRDNFGLNLRWSSKLAYRDSKTGLQFAQVAASLRPDSLTARLNLATLLWVNGDNEGAARECQRVLKQDADNVRAQILLADLLKEEDEDEHEKERS
jgi:Tfp pilus assembly protein PilF